MAHNLEEINFEKVNNELVQGCTIVKSNIRNDANWLKLTCITCNQIGYFEDEYQQGKAAGMHFADKNKYPIK